MDEQMLFLKKMTLLVCWTLALAAVRVPADSAKLRFLTSSSALLVADSLVARVAPVVSTETDGRPSSL